MVPQTEPANRARPAAIGPAAHTVNGIDPACGDATARTSRNAFAGGDYRPARLLLQSTKEPKLREFYVRALQTWQGRPRVFETWKQAEPESPAAWLVSGAHMIDWAWQARGSGRADTCAKNGTGRTTRCLNSPVPPAKMPPTAACSIR